MEVTRLADALPYEAPKHFDMRGLRLQGFDASGSASFWVGLSNFLPGGGAEMDSTPLEKVYVVVDGEVTVSTENGETVLGRYDSCRVAPGEARSIENRTNLPALMLVVMPYPEGPAQPARLREP
jgi:quercetin dioxygenase-like cupin family protein